MARRRIARVHADRLHPLDADGGARPEVAVGSAAWFSWLDEPEHASFAYTGSAGTFTA